MGRTRQRIARQRIARQQAQVSSSRSTPANSQETTPQPGGQTPGTIAQLQRTIGNTALQRLLAADAGGSSASLVQRDPDPSADASAPVDTLTSAQLAGVAELEAAYQNTAPIKRGDNGSGVIKLQEALIKLGYKMPRSTKDGSPDGDFGGETYRVVSSFQRRHHVGRTRGVVDRGTLGKMDELFGGRSWHAKTGYIGLNPNAYKEADALKKRLGDDAMISLNEPGVDANFDTDDEINAWVGTTLGIKDPQQAALAAACLKGADQPFREQMAAMMQMFNGAQQGTYRLERLVMSGHSIGSTLWGDNKSTSGTMVLAKDLANLVKAFPVAAAQVQDIMFSGCFTREQAYKLPDLFPNVETIWTYAEFSPKVDEGSPRHVAQWEGQTRGDQSLQRGDAMGSAALWTKERGFLTQEPGANDLFELEEAISAMEPRWQKMFEGTDALDQNFLRSYYRYQQFIKVHPVASESQKQKAATRVSITLRLRYWTEVCQHFANDFKTQIADAYKGVGLTAPDFATIDRAGVMSTEARFRAALKTDSPDAARRFLERELAALKTLENTDVIPDGWISHDD